MIVPYIDVYPGSIQQQLHNLSVSLLKYKYEHETNDLLYTYIYMGGGRGMMASSEFKWLIFLDEKFFKKLIMLQKKA